MVSDSTSNGVGRSWLLLDEETYKTCDRVPGWEITGMYVCMYVCVYVCMHVETMVCILP